MLPYSLYYSLLEIALHPGLDLSEEHIDLSIDLVSFSFSYSLCIAGSLAQQ